MNGPTHPPDTAIAPDPGCPILIKGDGTHVDQRPVAEPIHMNPTITIPDRDTGLMTDPQVAGRITREGMHESRDLETWRRKSDCFVHIGIELEQPVASRHQQAVPIVRDRENGSGLRPVLPAGGRDIVIGGP